MKFSNKISISIFITGIFVLSLALYATYKINYDSIIKSQILYTNSITEKISTDTDNLLKEKVKTAIIMANAPIIIEA